MSKKTKELKERKELLIKKSESYEKQSKAIRTKTLNKALKSYSPEKRFTVNDKIEKYNQMLECTFDVCKNTADFKNIEADFEVKAPDNKSTRDYFISKKEFLDTCCSADSDERQTFEKWRDNEERFKKQYKTLKRFLSIAENGVKGETAAFDSLKMLDYKIEILRNINTYLDEMIVEHDFVLITESGVFSIEVKYLSPIKGNSLTITEQGILKGKNVIEQTRKHTHSLKKLLIGTKYENIPVYSIIMFSNDRCNVKNLNSYIATCYRSNIENLIFDTEKYPICLDKRDFKEIKNILVLASKDVPCIRYPLDIDEKEYYEALADYVSTEWLLQKLLEITTEIKEIDSFLDQRSEGIKTLGAIAAGLLWGILDS